VVEAPGNYFKMYSKSEDYTACMAFTEVGCKVQCATSLIPRPPIVDSLGMRVVGYLL